MTPPDFTAVGNGPCGECRGHPVTGCYNLQAKQFAGAIPRRPYATDNPKEGIWRQNRAAALLSRYIQANASHLLRYIVMDVDRPGAYFAARDAILPAPNWIAENRDNGRAHLAYELAAPVTRSDAGHIAPLRYLAAVERGLTRRLEADPGYAGLVTKNPLHPDWRTGWGPTTPYQLAELADWLHRSDMRKCNAIGDATGLGRNCTLFEELRVLAYKKVLPFKREGVLTPFNDYLMEVATALNCQFEAPLPLSEVRATVRSVAKWTWRRFDEHHFSRIQALRGQQGGLRSGEVRLEQRDARTIVARDLQTRLSGCADPPPKSGLSDMASCPKKCHGGLDIKDGGDHGKAR